MCLTSSTCQPTFITDFYLDTRDKLVAISRPESTGGVRHIVALHERTGKCQSQTGSSKPKQKTPPSPVRPAGLIRRYPIEHHGDHTGFVVMDSCCLWLNASSSAILPNVAR